MVTVKNGITLGEIARWLRECEQVSAMPVDLMSSWPGWRILQRRWQIEERRERARLDTYRYCTIQDPSIGRADWAQADSWVQEDNTASTICDDCGHIVHAVIEDGMQVFPVYTSAKRPSYQLCQSCFDQAEQAGRAKEKGRHDHTDSD